MGVTGWIGEEQDRQAPAMPTTAFLLANRADPEQARTLEQVLARALAAPDRDSPEREDADDRFAAMVSRGYAPGQLSQLAQRLGDVSAELQAEREKLERGARRAEQVHRMHQAGRVSAWQIPDLLDDLGDEARVRQLERQQSSLAAQLEEAHQAAAPPERRNPEPLEAAAQRAHQAFAEHTRALLAEAEAGRRTTRPPFGSASRGGVAVRSEVACADCVKVGASAEESWMIHNDPDGPIETQFVGLSEQVLAAFGREDQSRAQREGRARLTGHEIVRTTGSDAIVGVW